MNKFKRACLLALGFCIGVNVGIHLMIGGENYWLIKKDLLKQLKMMCSIFTEKKILYPFYVKELL